MNIEPKLIPASLQEHPVIQNMARFYVYDLSRSCGFISKDWALPENGLYESFDFQCYITDPKRKAYIIRVADELAGFVLLNKVTQRKQSDWNMGEFFILAKFQGKGVGKRIAHLIWQIHPGYWEVSVIPENTSAYLFWKNSIKEFTQNQFDEGSGL